ncbi:MAG: hypothetical protein WA918_02495 [Erythrobacter sp.]
MIRVAKLAMCVCLAVSSVLPVGARADEAEPVQIAGQCEYADRLAPLLEQFHTFAICDRLQMRRTGSRVELNFSHASRNRSIRFAGAFEKEGRLNITGIRLRGQSEWNEAEGTCTFDPPEVELPVVTCIVKSGARFFVANFAPER